MFKTINNAFAHIKAVFTLSDSPINTIEKRLCFITKIQYIHGWHTHDENWRPNIRMIMTIALMISSLGLDVNRARYMFEHRKEEKIEDIVETLVYIVTQSVCSYRIYLVIRYREKNRMILRTLTKDFCKWLTTDERTDIMRRSSRHGWFLFKMDTMILFMTAMFFVTRSLIGHTFPTSATGLELPYVDNEQSPYYEILWCLQIWILTAQIFMALALNNMFCTLAVMVCSHLECLMVDVDMLNKSNSEGNSVDVILDMIIQKYVSIHKTVQNINDLYGTQLGLQPLYTGAVIITSTLLYDGNQKSNVFLQISFDHIIELFIYCYIGDLVSQKSTALAHRLYSVDWITMNNSHKKTVLQMMHRCQKPFTLNAGIFGPLTIEMYSKSMQMTYSMWTVFKGRAAHK